MKRGFIALFIFILNTSALAQADSVDVFVKNQMEKRKIPGLQLAIVRHGVIIKTGNYGWANLQDSIPVTDKTVFTINSITKAFVGVAIMQLVEAGKLTLTSPLSTYLDDIPATWKTVTIQQLLAHTSGIPDIVDEEESVLIAPGLEASWKQVIAMPIVFKPGERFSYNQTNYLLLGQVIDKMSGMSFREYIVKEQLAKAGMARTIKSGFGATKEVIPNAAAGYQYSKGNLSNMFFAFPPALQTAAGMSSTATEMANWIIALQSYRLLKHRASINTLWSPAILNTGNTGGFGGLLNGYAVGWPIVGRADHPAAAAVGGGRSALFVYPKDSLSIVVLTNLSGGSPEAFIDELAGFFIPGMKEANGFGLSTAVKLVRGRLEKIGYQFAIEEVAKLKKTREELLLTEREINNWGYKLVSQNRLTDAREIFKLNVSLYPESPNAFDSLGEIYAALGNVSMAIKNYQQSLKLDPQNKNAAQQIRQLSSTK